MLAALAAAAAAEPVSVILNNGPSTNRADLVVLGDGFTAADIASGTYAAAVQLLMQRVLSGEPYLEYSSLMNVIRVDVTSAQSGADHPSRGIAVDTALDATYDCSGHHPPDLRVDHQGQPGAGAQRDPAVGPRSRDRAGSTIRNTADRGARWRSCRPMRRRWRWCCTRTATPLRAWPTSTAARRRRASCRSRPTRTRRASPTARRSWRQWIAASTPVPTPGTTNGVPGLYEGAVYCDTGAYRPTCNSKMRSLGRPFEAVNEEQHILRFYNLVSPIDSWTPAQDAVTVQQGVSRIFATQGPTPRTHAYAFTWTVDGTAVSAQPAFDASTLPVGLHRVEVTVHDDTAAVRADPGNLLSETHGWNVTVEPVVPGQTPTNLSATVTGNTVSLQWDAPTALTPIGYVLSAGVTPGGVAVTLPTGSAVPGFSVVAPSGVFYLRVHALLSGGALSAPSNEIQVAVNVPVAPNAPVNLLAGGTGSRLVLAWMHGGGGTPTTSLLEVSGAITLTVPLPAAEGFTFDAVPPGTYTFRVREQNAVGVSAQSNAASLTFPVATCLAPSTPVNLRAGVSGGAVSIAWDLPASGAAPRSYVLSVTGAVTGALPLATRGLSAVAPPGVYNLRVAAVNDCGSSAPTGVVVLTVP
ncbi:MAG: M64 family metallopeptidase [Candidatus Binatia bacterium]